MHPEQVRENAKFRYFQGQSLKEIEEALNQEGQPVNYQTLWRWKESGNWTQIKDPIVLIRANVNKLMSKMEKEGLTSQELSTLDKLMIMLDRDAARKEKASRAAEKNGGGLGTRRKQRGYNDFSEVDFSTIVKPFEYAFQKAFRADLSRVRAVEKSRQIGWSLTISREALDDALATNKNKIFISGSKNQVSVLRGYIRNYAHETFGVELRGSDRIEIITPSGTCTLYFLSSNWQTAQSYNGDLIIDEAAWIPKFDELKRIARPMMVQHRFRMTYITTPSSTDHPFYQVWAGLDEEGNKIKDSISRHSVTLDSAIAQGFDLIRKEDIEADGYTSDEYEQLFNCKWINTKESFFKMRTLQDCQVDQELIWQGRKSWLGYDPSRSANGDSAALVVLEYRPEINKIVLVYQEKFKGMKYKLQGKRIKEIVKAYDVEYIGIDITGIGGAVYEQIEDLKQEGITIKQFYYDIAVKQDLVLNAKGIIEDPMFVYNVDNQIMTRSILTVRLNATESGQVTFRSKRGVLTGHGDFAWALFHALNNFRYSKNKTRTSRNRRARVSSTTHSLAKAA